MLKINNPQINNSLFNQAKVSKKPDIVVSTNPITTPKNANVGTDTLQAYYMPSFTALCNAPIKDGRVVAQNLNRILDKKIAAVDTKEFNLMLKQVTPKNVVSTLKTANEISPKKSLMAKILTETGSSTNDRVAAANHIFNALVERGKKHGVKTDHFKKNFDEELQKQADSLLPINPTKIDYITGGLLQTFDNKHNLTDLERKAIRESEPAKLHEFANSVLDRTFTNSKTEFTDIKNAEGYFSKIADNVKALWNSENRSKVVEADLDKYDKQLATLKNSKSNEEYENNFKEIFNIEYDPELIATYKNKEVQLKAVVLAESMEKSLKSSFKDLLSMEPLQDKQRIVNAHQSSFLQTVETKQQIFDRNFDALSIHLGKGNKEEGAKLLNRRLKDRKIGEDATIEEKFAGMQKIAKRDFRNFVTQKKMISDGKDLNTLRKEYNSSYNAAFGVENDIARRVMDYKISQELGQVASETLILSPIVIAIGIATAGTGIIPALKGGAITAGMNAAAYTADRLSSKNGMTKEDIKEIAAYSVLDGSTFLTSYVADLGIKAFTSAAFKGASTVAKLTNMTLLTVAETAADAAVGDILYGEYSDGEKAYSAYFSLAGQLLEMKLLR